MPWTSSTTCWHCITDQSTTSCIRLPVREMSQYTASHLTWNDSKGNTFSKYVLKGWNLSISEDICTMKYNMVLQISWNQNLSWKGEFLFKIISSYCKSNQINFLHTGIINDRLFGRIILVKLLKQQCNSNINSNRNPRFPQTFDNLIQGLFRDSQGQQQQ